MNENWPLALSVNVDHVATLREARKSPYPDPIEAAQLAVAAGAEGITVHLRGDRRHIQDDDVRRLRQTVDAKLNVEISMADDLLALAVELQPDQVTLVPERPEEITTEGGLDVIQLGSEIASAAEKLVTCGCSVSVFLDPDPAQVKALSALDRELIPGFEINTDAYAQSHLNEDPDAAIAGELAKIQQIASLGAELDFAVFAGHGITTANVPDIAVMPEVEELNIGHWLVSRAVMVGMTAAVTEMLDAIKEARG